MRACTLGSAFKRPLPGRAPAASARISVCARIYDSSYGTHPWRTFGAGELGPENRREGGERTMRVSTQRARMKGRVFSGKGQRYRPRNGNVASEGRCDDVTTRR